MASKIVVFFLIVTICKIQSQAINGYQNSASANARAQATSSTQAAAGPQPSGKTKTTQTQSPPVQSANGNTGITASPRLQILPGQGNVQAIPLSQLADILQKRGLLQNCGGAPRTGNTGVQGKQSPQVQLAPVQVSSPSLGIQPSVCGPSSVITAPVSAITIPPTACTTIIDCSLSNSLANCLQMMLAQDFINSAAGCNIANQDGIQMPVVEAVVPGVDLTNMPCAQTQTCQESYYDWATIQNFLKQQNEQANPVVSPQCETTSADLAALISYLNQNCRTIDQLANQQPQVCPQTCGDVASNGVLEALAAYLGCSTSEVSSNSYPCIPEIQFPAEIPAQLVCNYGYMPTTVPVVSFCVQPLNNAADGFIVGSQCLQK